MVLDTLVSIIVPVYNAEQYLKRCIDSIINQTYQGIEVILVDDGSFDCSPELCDQYAQTNSFVRVIHKQNEGPSIARASGLKMANGQYVAFVDSDDYIEPEMISTMIANFHDDVDIVECGYFVVSDEGKVIKTVELVPEVIKGARESLMHYSVKRNTTNYLWNKLFRVDLFQNVVFPDLYAGEDSCLLTQLFAYAKGTSTINTPLYNYVMTPESLCRKPFSEKNIDNIYAGEFMFDFYSKHFPDLVVFPALHICSYAARLYSQIKNSDLHNKTEKQESMLKYFNKYYKYSKNKFAKSNSSLNKSMLIKLFKISPSLTCYIYDHLVCSREKHKLLMFI